MKAILSEIHDLLSDSKVDNQKIRLAINKIEEAKKLNSQLIQTSTLVNFSKEVSKIQDLDEIFSFTANKMHELLGNGYSLLFCSKYNNTEKLELVSLIGDDTLKQKMEHYFNENLISREIPIDQKHKNAILSHQLFKLPSLRTVLMDVISVETAIEWEEELGVSHFYGYGFSDNKNLLASYGIITKEEIPTALFELFQVILNLLNTIVIQKAESEKTITLYNHMTRILDISNYVFGIFNKNGQLLKGNTIFKKLFSCIPNDIINIHHKVFYKEIGLNEQSINEIKNGFAINIDVNNFSKLFDDKKSLFSVGNITPVVTSNKEVEYYLIFMQSIAEDSRLIKSMQLQEDKYHRIFNHIQNVYFEVSFDGIISEISPSIEKHFGYSRESMLGKNILDLYLNKSDRKDYIKELHENGEVHNYKIELVNKDNNIIYALITSSVINADTDNEQIIGSLINISNRHKHLQEISKNEIKFRSLFEHSPLGIMICNTDGKIVDINKLLLKILGSPSKEESQKFNIFELENLIQSGISAKIKESIDKKKELSFETQYKSYWDNIVYVKIFINPVINEDGQIQSVILMAEDISKIKTIDIELHETQERLKEVYEKTSDLIYTMDFDGNFTSVNPTGIRWLGYDFNHLKNKNMKQFISLDSFNRAQDNISKKLKKDADQTTYEITAFNNLGKKLTLEVNSFIRYKDNKPFELFGIARNITERKKHADFIQSALREKEALFKEMHHRVKNNLQVILSLLKMHKLKFKDTHTIHAFNDISQKILAISAVHEDFYFSNDFKEIPFDKYLKTIICNALENTEADENIQAKIDIGKIDTDIDTAIPIGLLISELLSNSIRYAFTKTDQLKEIHISMSSIGDTVLLKYSDNGQGFDINAIKLEDKDSGIQLVQMLTENQLEGEFKIESDNEGTRISVEFPNTQNTI